MRAESPWDPWKETGQALGRKVTGMQNHPRPGAELPGGRVGMQTQPPPLEPTAGARGSVPASLSAPVRTGAPSQGAPEARGPRVCMQTLDLAAVALKAVGGGETRLRIKLY